MLPLLMSVCVHVMYFWKFHLRAVSSIFTYICREGVMPSGIEEGVLDHSDHISDIFSAQHDCLVIGYPMGTEIF